ncbi:GNAT family N-acetyltransferase [Marininema halotolerans]|uniref:Lysine N-acyltransferase MbtK n=1 Tax=Marininema halotolerans TaxID=1155944 RepID=A0A1I6PZ78_9BACL|nr:GNAT family N-acetyltransferase [Marininema halotolerans]SFS45472.1 Acetyltransferase (GNAT) domain-containing protein [Marininema halotolerans]
MKKNRILHSKYIDDLGLTMSIRKLDLINDFEVLHDWMHRPYISPFWKLDVSNEDFSAYLKRTTSTPGREHFIFELDGEPFSFLLTYLVRNEDLKDHYDDFDINDIGVHVVIGERSYIAEKYVVPYFQLGLDFVFKRNKESKKIIGEPDRRNRIIIPSAKKAGFISRGKITLPHKVANLIVADRIKFYERNEDETHV